LTDAESWAPLFSDWQGEKVSISVPILIFPRRMTVHVAVEFPLAAQRWGTDAVLELARAIEDVGYDEIDLFEHVTVGHPIPGRSETRQAAPELLEPLVPLGEI
jgi:hypothetical protein